MIMAPIITSSRLMPAVPFQPRNRLLDARRGRGSSRFIAIMIIPQQVAFHLLSEKLPAEDFRGLGADVLHSGGKARLALDIGHFHPRDAAGSYLLERRQASPDIQGEPVHAYPMAHADADGGDLPLPHPDAGKVFAPRRADAVFLQGEDENLFQQAEVTVQILPVSTQVEDRVADELSRPVIGRLPSAIDPHDRMWQRRGVAQAGLVGRAADRINGRVFEQQEEIVVQARGFPGHRLLLQGERLVVFDLAKPADLQAHTGFNGSAPLEAACRAWQCARPTASASAASGGGFSCNPSSARTMKETCVFTAAPRPTTACFTRLGAYS